MALRCAILLLWLLGVGACGPSSEVQLSRDDSTRIYKLDERRLDAYLRCLSSERPDVRERVSTIARATIGQPYRLGPLGEYPFEMYDPDPLYCLSASDCVTFVEQTLAMAMSRDWPGFFQTLQRIRYNDGRIGMLTRNHFTEADWNVNNAWLLEDITKTLPGVEPYSLRIDRAAFFKQFGLTFDTAPVEFEDAYVPRRLLPNALPLLLDADIIEFVRSDKGRLYVGHLGFVFHDSNGQPTLLHATKPAVREEPLAEYIARHENIAGLKVLRLRSEKVDAE